MSPDLDTPDPPSLRGPQSTEEYEAVDTTDQYTGDDYRRDDLADILESGAWDDAFQEWADDTYLSKREFETVLDLGLIEQLDFYWDPSTDETGYRVPSVSEGASDEFEGVGVDEVESELDSLARTVTEMLENDYLHRDEETFGFFQDTVTGHEATDEEG